jgi:hypothetical protein
MTQLMKDLKELTKQAHKNIDDHAKLEIDLIEIKSQSLLKQNELQSNKLIIQNESIIRKHYGTD